LISVEEEGLTQKLASCVSCGNLFQGSEGWVFGVEREEGTAGRKERWRRCLGQLTQGILGFLIPIRTPSAPSSGAQSPSPPIPSSALTTGSSATTRSTGMTMQWCVRIINGSEPGSKGNRMNSSGTSS
jgi:hypothetical protein